MLKDRLMWVIAAVIISVGIVLFSQADNIFLANKKLIAPMPQKTQPEVERLVQENRAATIEVKSVASGKLDMSPDSKVLYSPSPKTEADYSYSLRRDNKEVVIMSGVSYVPGEGLNIKTAKKDEVVQIQRDNSYSTDYQVMLKKKY